MVLLPLPLGEGSVVLLPRPLGEESAVLLPRPLGEGSAVSLPLPLGEGSVVLLPLPLGEGSVVLLPLPLGEGWGEGLHCSQLKVTHYRRGVGVDTAATARRLKTRPTRRPLESPHTP